MKRIVNPEGIETVNVVRVLHCQRKGRAIAAPTLATR